MDTQRKMLVSSIVNILSVNWIIRDNLPQTDALHHAAIAFLMVQGALNLNLLCLQALHQMGPLTLG